MKKETREFYKKDIEYNKFFEKKKKISFDINKDFLELVDKLAKVTKNNRTIIIDALMGEGMAPFFKHIEDIWRGLLNEEKYKKIEKVMKKNIEDLQKLKEEYHIGDIEKEYKRIRRDLY